MLKQLPFESVLKLIEDMGFGTYKLFSGNELVAGSHLVVDDNDKKGSLQVNELIEHLCRKVELLGDGVYKIILKKSNVSASSVETTYRFAIQEKEDEPVQQVNKGYAGLGSVEDIEKLVNERLTKALIAESEKRALEQKLFLLELENKTLRSRKPSRKKEKDLMGILGGLGMMGAAAFISEKYPNSVPLVEKVLGAMSDEEEDEEDEEEGTGFTRPQA